MALVTHRCPFEELISVLWQIQCQVANLIIYLFISVGYALLTVVYGLGFGKCGLQTMGIFFPYRCIFFPFFPLEPLFSEQAPIANASCVPTCRESFITNLNNSKF
jgi:hypothetical protein